MQQSAPPPSMRESLVRIFSSYVQTRTTVPFHRDAPVWHDFEALASGIGMRVSLQEKPHLSLRWSVGQGNWARIPWIALLDSRLARSIQDGIYVVYLFREDMSGVYLTLNQGVTEPHRRLGAQAARRYLRERATDVRTRIEALQDSGFSLDHDIDLRTNSSLGDQYVDSTIAHKFYDAVHLPSDDEITHDLLILLATYEQFADEFRRTPFHYLKRASELVDAVAGHGFFFEPWQIATFLTALRTKPFVILAGVSGTGKSKLPLIMAEATGGIARLIPVRPDWTDSSEVLGYTDLQETFRPGAFLRFVLEASEHPDRFHICVIDEMNLARVEHYFAEILSRMEDRVLDPETGGYRSREPLVVHATDPWNRLHLPSNFAIVGTVNMDESTHGFSKKVLDRAFTIEFSEVDLTAWNTSSMASDKRQAASGLARADARALQPETWPVPAWQPRAIQLSGLDEFMENDREIIDRVVTVLTEINKFLTPAQLQVGYRTRDEVALFCLHAKELEPLFRTRTGEAVDPLDLALHMKILPRIAGGSTPVRQAVLGLLGWAHDGSPMTEDRADDVLRTWQESGRPTAWPGSRYPRTAARLALMWERITSEGFTSFWL